MQVDMQYGHGIVAIDIPDKNLVGVLDTTQTVPLANPKQAVRNAISKPIASSATEIAAISEGLYVPAKLENDRWKTQS